MMATLKLLQSAIFRYPQIIHNPYTGINVSDAQASVSGFKRQKELLLF